MSAETTLANAFLSAMTTQLDQSALKLHHCLGQLTTEQLTWRPHADGNAVANLIVHVCGNLQQWLMAGLGNAVDTRDRASEFRANQAWSHERLEDLIETTLERAHIVLASVPQDVLTTKHRIQGFDVTGLEAISHTVSHFTGHTHQVIQLTRLMLQEQYRFHWMPDSPRGDVPI